MSAAMMVQAAAATPFDGVYDKHSQTCVQPLSDARIEISERHVRMWEGGCDLSNPTAIRDMPDALLYDADCWSEDVRYKGRTILMRLAPHFQMSNRVDLAMIRNGEVTFYVACPPGTRFLNE